VPRSKPSLITRPCFSQDRHPTTGVLPILTQQPTQQIEALSARIPPSRAAMTQSPLRPASLHSHAPPAPTPPIPQT
jgi:hypothetical protein